MSLPPSLLVQAALAGAIVILTPGPAVLAFLGIGAAQGRRAGAVFLFGCYLAYLGMRNLLARRDATGRAEVLISRPLLRGLVFGLSNPKSYPVTLAVYTALLAAQLSSFTLGQAPGLLASCFAGFLAADAILIWLVGMGALRRFYRRHEIWILRATGLMFLGFAANTLLHAWHGWSSEVRP